MLFVTGRRPFEAGSFDWATLWLITVQSYTMRHFRSVLSDLHPRLSIR